MKDDVIILVCGRLLMGQALLIEDNLTGPCDTCGHTVQYRPHAPKPHILRCMQCAPQFFQPGDTHFTTRRMVEDAEAYFKRKQH